MKVRILSECLFMLFSELFATKEMKLIAFRRIVTGWRNEQKDWVAIFKVCGTEFKFSKRLCYTFELLNLVTHNFHPAHLTGC